eukprot:scaffold220205_cov37-Tisochrysis_lutea.AAC.1
MKMHLMWRGLSTSGDKTTLAERLRSGIAKSAPLLRALPSKSCARPPETPWHWEALSSATRPISRTPFQGESNWAPAAQVGLDASSHPFSWFNKMMHVSMREKMVATTNKYQGYLIALGKEK